MLQPASKQRNVKGFAGPGIDAGLIQHEHRVFYDAHPSQPSHSRMHNLAARSAALGEVSRAACSSLVGKSHVARQQERLRLDWTGARDTGMQLWIRLPMPHSMRDPARRGRQRAIQMARSASLAAVPAIVSMGLQSAHGVPPLTSRTRCHHPRRW